MEYYCVLILIYCLFTKKHFCFFKYLFFEQMIAFLINGYKFINILLCDCNGEILKTLQKFIFVKGVRNSTI